MQAKYTVFLKDLLENEEIKPLIDKALSTYPIYIKKSKEEYIPSVVPTREELNEKLLNAYKYREIGFETVGRFVDELEISMKEIMPYYNQILFTLDQDYNILYNVDYTRTTNTEREGEVEGNTVSESINTATSTGTDSSTTTASVENDNKHVESATPQGQLGITAKNIDSVDYADKVSWDKGNTSDTGTTSGNSQTTAEGSQSGNTTTTGTNKDTEHIDERIIGNYGQVSAQSLIERYRDLIANVEQDIINDRRIKELFMMVW
jgi:hypothetical protein